MSGDHVHGPDGQIIPVDPEVVEETVAADAVTEVAETTAAAEVEVAKVNARRDVQVAELGLEREKIWQEGRVAELEGRVRGMEEVIERLTAPPAPEPQPEPVVVKTPPEPQQDVAPAPEPSDGPPEGPPEGKKKKGGFWGPAYS